MPQADAAALDELNVVLEEFRRAQEAFCRGDGEPVKRCFSRRDDVTLGNPLGPVARGWPDVEDAIERAAANFRDGGDVRYDEISRYVTPELAYVVQVERVEARVGGREERSPISLRVTLTFRHEDSTWKIVHRHADPITAARPAESVIQN